MAATGLRPENRLNLDYREEAKRFTHKIPIIDMHSHINGARAVELYKQAADLYGIERVYSMTQLESIDSARKVLGDRLQLISMPSWGNGKTPLERHGTSYQGVIREFARQGAKICKFWSAPRILEGSDEPFATNPLRLTSPIRLETMKVAESLGMSFMVHVGDPDTWFQTKYRDAARYGTKQQHYELLEEMLSTFQVPTIAAHCGGYPEDLEFLSTLLSRYPHLYLDLSATKWMVRELSKHPRAVRIKFFEQWKGRLMFGSDIVTTDQHLLAGEKGHEMFNKASTENEAFDLYASRYWALRTLFETDYEGESPIADPDLKMVDPEKYTELDAPRLVGAKLSEELLKTFYRDAALSFLKIHAG